MKRALFTVLLLLSLSLAACAKADRAPPLPGDSVATDGAVSLKSPSLVTVGSPGAGAGAPALSPIESRLYPAELVMEHQAEINLTPAQRDGITKELDKTQPALVKLQWELQTEKDNLVKVLSDAKVDEAKSQKAAASLMARENAIKAAHLDLLVRIKNLLTPDQQARLGKTRDAERCASPKDGGTD